MKVYIGTPGVGVATAFFNYVDQADGGTSTSNVLSLFQVTDSGTNNLDGAQLSNFTLHSRKLGAEEHEAQFGGRISRTGLVCWAPLGLGTPEPDLSSIGASGAISGSVSISSDGPPINVPVP